MSLIKNINAWKTKTEKAKKQVKITATEYVRKQAMAVLREAIRVSPQFSGDFALNWVIETKQISGAYDSHLRGANYNWKAVPKSERKKAGDPIPGIAWVYAGMTEAVLPAIKWNSNVRLANHSPMAGPITSGEIKFRPENLVYAPDGVIAHLNARFRYLKKL